MESLFVPYEAVSALPGKRVLVLAPHPDDEVFGCGGSIMRHVELGAAVTVVIFTDGAHGSTGIEADAVRETRRQESRAAAAELGYGEPRFLDWPDRGLGYGEQLISTIETLCVETGADLVYAPCVLEMHPDHRSLGMAALEVLRRQEGSMHLACYEVGIPLRPSHLLDISALMDRKARAMACFPSQLTRQRYDLDVAALNRYRTYTLPEAVTAAEAYMVLSRDDLEHDPMGLFRPEYQRQREMGLPLLPADVPLVSVIIRSMDRDVLSRALDSVALQTYSNIEVVLVNASGYPHRDPGAWCGRHPLRLVDPGRALGRSAAANAGLDAARGELLMFLDDDDQFLPHHIASLQQRLAGAGSKVVAAYAGIVCRDDAGIEHHRYQRPFDALWFAIGNFIPIHAVLFRRAVLGDTVRFDEDLAHCEDWDFWLQLHEKGDFELLPQIGGIYHVAPGTGSGLWGNAALAREAMLKIQRKRLPHWSDDQLWGLFELAQYKPLYERTVREAAQLHVQADTLATQITLAQERQQQLEQRLIAMQLEHGQHIADLQASTSWRVTAPLRKASALLRGARTEPAAGASVSVAATATSDIAGTSRVDAAIHEVNAIEDALVSWVDGTTDILLAGNLTDAIASRIRQRGPRRVTAVDHRLSAIEAVRSYCDNVVSADLDDPDWTASLEAGQPFNTLVASDSLEHLRNPWHALKQMGELIGDDGYVVASFSHAGHAALTGSLVAGMPEYGTTGPLQRSRLRFFGLRQIDALFAGAGLKIVEAAYVTRHPGSTPLADVWATLPDATRQVLLQAPHATIYQVAVKAVAMARTAAPLSLAQLPADTGQP